MTTEGPEEVYVVVLADGSKRSVLETGEGFLFVARDGSRRGLHPSAIEAIRAHPALHTLDTQVVQILTGHLSLQDIVDTLVVAPGVALGAAWEIDGVTVVNCGWDGHGRKGQLWFSEDVGLRDLGEEILHVADAAPAGDSDLIYGVWYSRVGGLETLYRVCEGREEYRVIGRRRLRASDYMSCGYFTDLSVLELDSSIFDDRALLRELTLDTRYVTVNGRRHVRWTRAWERPDDAAVDLPADDDVWAEFASTRIEVASGHTDRTWRAWVPIGTPAHVDVPDGDGLHVISAFNPRRRRLSVQTNLTRTRTLAEMIWKFDTNTLDGGLWAIRPAVRRSLGTGRAEPSWAAALDGAAAVTLGRYAGQVAVFCLGPDHIDIVNCGTGPSWRVPCEVVDVDAPADALEPLWW